MKHKTKGILMIFLMLHSCIIPISCMTVETYKGNGLNELQVPVDKIKTIYLKSGEKISLENTVIRPLKSGNGSVYAFARGVFDTTWLADKKNFSVSASVDTIRLNDVREFVVKELDLPLTIVAGLGIAAGVALIAYIIGVLAVTDELVNEFEMK